MKKILLPALAAGLVLSASALDVVKGGKAAAVIVVPDKPTKGEWKEMIIDNIQVNADCQIQLHLCSVRQSKGIVWFDDVILAEK